MPAKRWINRDKQIVNTFINNRELIHVWKANILKLTLLVMVLGLWGFVMRDCISPGFTNQQTAFYGKFGCNLYVLVFCITNGVAATYF